MEDYQSLQRTSGSQAATVAGEGLKSPGGCRSCDSCWVSGHSWSASWQLGRKIQQGVEETGVKLESVGISALSLATCNHVEFYGVMAATSFLAFIFHWKSLLAKSNLGSYREKFLGNSVSSWPNWHSTSTIPLDSYFFFTSTFHIPRVLGKRWSCPQALSCGTRTLLGCL